ncbi:MAG TPA: bifunctional DNA-formamidopyrimidine glycosylase/DNA-(apurinic or apyrimidinic site) lyase [Beutenbergiaceae bacterium]|nr:bifunctional DNA-formamidopyrimidine glycosylase/DNA-(apurinic or apyrimidinic site) lyase [Beutenbergiaceae bacterium]
MPELPEVETVRAGLEPHVLGRRISSAQVYRDRAVRRQDGGPEAFAALLAGRTIGQVVRRGKFCWLTLTGPDGVPEDYALLVHLGMSGQMLVKTSDAGTEGHPHLRVRLQLEEGTQLWFVDQRTFGYLSVEDLVPTVDHGPGGFAGQDVAAALVPLAVAHIGRDLLDPALAPGTGARRELNRRLRAGRRGIKRALLDQSLISGIGNIYADEALWRTKVHYDQPTDRMSAARIEAVLEAAIEVLAEALAAGGTSFDALYVNIEGVSGYFARSLNVYGREGLPCKRCGTPILREKFMNRSSHFCPVCQRRR